MKIADFVQKAKNTKGVNLLKDNSSKDFMGVWNTDLNIWSKDKQVLVALSFHCPNDFDIMYVDSGEYMMQVYSTAKPRITKSK